MFEVLDRTENLPPGKPTRHYRKTLLRTRAIWAGNKTGSRPIEKQSNEEQ